MMEVMQVFFDNGKQIITIALELIGAFAVIATASPNKSDDRVVQWFLDIFNFLGANFGKAKNQ